MRSWCAIGVCLVVSILGMQIGSDAAYSAITRFMIITCRHFVW